ncbi:hypothetical protein C7974DRAFT_372708 [Boeremia exigua]|uniref:uncharacterized protein n=1 Tax=Boeremia exigua TaxID=749465 RepID=UPI001E8E8803|nr:uncharacterized protein C7974DRAFT_372708 [Boeremia exigua]KAH6642845.1 hypothetical protein C7974DRAFT_372708 [Boeremia exigua]
MSHDDAVQSLAELYEQCASAFQSLLSRLNDPAFRTRQRDSLSLDAAAEEYGKLRIWAEQTRVILPPGSRGSLDELVRDRAKTKRILLTNEAANAALDASNEHHGLPNTAASRGLVTSDLNDQETVLDLTISSQHQSQTKLIKAMRHVSEQRAGLAGKYLRSNKSERDNENSMQEFLPFDQGHVQEKLLQWYDDWAAQNKGDYRGRISNAAASVQVPKDLTLRLALANMMRRKQLRYWLHHADSPEKPPTHADLEPRVRSQAKLPPSSTDQATAFENLQLPPPLSEAAPTTKSKVSFSTAIMSAVNENPVAQTEYEESVIGKFGSTRVPPLPQVAHENTEFKCPYCGLSLKSSVMRSRRAWKDLRPYVCTFSDCVSATRLYHARHDWIYHENQMHRRQWACSDDCHQAFQDPQSFITHLRNSHSEMVLGDQLPLILTLSERPMSDEKIESCPLCPTNMPLSRLFSHVAQHLEQLSLFVLSFSNSDAEGGSEASHQAEDDHGGNFHGVSEDSSMDDRWSTQEVDDDNESIVWDTEPVIENTFGIPPPEDPQLWTKLFSTSPVSAQSADSDPLLIDLQRKQAQRNKVDGTSGVQSGVSMTEEEVSEFKDAGEVRNFMVDHMANTEFNGIRQRFLPRPAFERVTSQSVILQMASVASDLISSKPMKDALVLEIRDYRKIFACCIYSMVSMDLFKGFMDMGISDAVFPFRSEDFPLTLEELLEQTDSEQLFMYSQRYFNTAYFELGSFQALDDRWSIPVDYDVSQPLWQGYWSEIFKVRIPFGEHSLHPMENKFAMRVYRFEKEYNMDVVRDVLQVKLKHTVQCFAAFSMPSSLYILYRLNDGNLEQYMSKVSRPKLDSSKLAIELRGIAAAVEKLHDGEFFNRILNIHPENIMVSCPDQSKMLCLWVESFQIIQPGPSGERKSAVLSPVYRPPEPLETASADSVASWSLGCLFLEILVWHVMGYDNLCKFRESRERPVRPGGRPNRAFYYFTETGPDARAQLREEVTDIFLVVWVRVTGRLSGSLKALEQMLQIDPKARLSAGKFRQRSLSSSIDKSELSDTGADYGDLGVFRTQRLEYSPGTSEGPEG